MICSLLPDHILDQIKQDYKDAERCPLDLLTTHKLLQRKGDKIISKLYQIKKARIPSDGNYQKVLIYLNLIRQYELNKTITFHFKEYS